MQVERPSKSNIVQRDYIPVERTIQTLKNSTITSLDDNLCFAECVHRALSVMRFTTHTRFNRSNCTMVVNQESKEQINLKTKTLSTVTGQKYLFQQKPTKDTQLYSTKRRRRGF